MSSKTLLTAAELEQMPDDDSVQIELDEGELIKMAPAALNHGKYEVRIAALLHAHAQRHALGVVYCGDTGFTLGPDTVRAPDVAFIQTARLASVEGDVFGNGAPDLAVEIFSPSDSVRQLMRKVKQYFAAGCHTVWIVYPDRREVQVLEAAGADRLLTDADTLEAPELLPGFSTPVKDVFG